MRLTAVWGCILPILLLSSTITHGAPDDPYRITSREKAACTSDAIRLCSQTYPDAHALLDCMKTNRTSLSSTCLVAFNAGLKRRNLN